MPLSNLIRLLLGTLILGVCSSFEINGQQEQSEEVTKEQYDVGDLAPPWRLPGVNFCDGTECDMAPRCVDSASEDLKSRPVFFAFFSSW